MDRAVVYSCPVILVNCKVVNYCADVNGVACVRVCSIPNQCGRDRCVGPIKATIEDDLGCGV